MDTSGNGAIGVDKEVIWVKHWQVTSAPRRWAPSQGQPAGARSLCMQRSDDGSQQRPVTPNCIWLRILPGQSRTSAMSADHGVANTWSPARSYVTTARNAAK